MQHLTKSLTKCRLGDNTRLTLHYIMMLKITDVSLSAALTSTVASVCNPSDVSCLDSYNFSPLDGLHRGPLSHEEPLNYSSNGDGDCINLLETGFYHSDLGQINVCGEDCDRPAAKRLKLGLSEPFMNDVSVGGRSVAVDFEGRTHHITSAKMAVSVSDFGEAGSYMGAHTLHQHTTLQSE